MLQLPYASISRVHSHIHGHWHMRTYPYALVFWKKIALDKEGTGHTDRPSGLFIYYLRVLVEVYMYISVCECFYNSDRDSFTACGRDQTRFVLFVTGSQFWCVSSTEHKLGSSCALTRWTKIEHTIHLPPSVIDYHTHVHTHIYVRTYKHAYIHITHLSFQLPL